jgi:tetratricopeptide (TPR) repeat protein
MTAVLRIALALLVAIGVGACATSRPAVVVAMPSVPRYPAFPTPEIPASLGKAGDPVFEDLRMRHANAWAHLQNGDLRAASRVFSALVKDAPGFYPAQAGLGFVDLANEDYDDAEPRFAAVVGANDSYLPGWVGRVEALLGLRHDAEAIAAMERVLALDPAQEAVRTRLELVRFRLTQSLLGSGQQARAAGRTDEAVTYFERALVQSPQSTMILNELARTEIAAGRLDDAERHARRAAQVEPREAAWQALLGDVLEARGQIDAAADAYARADTLDPGDAYRARGRELRERAELAALPESFRRLTTAETITRADVAAFVGIHLKDLVARAPVRATSVATDVRTNWAAAWILPVTRAGIMTVYPNHTFQPTAVVRRGDLAAVMAVLVQLAGAARKADLSQWQASRPRFADLPASNVFYSAAALVTAAGVMAPDATGRFSPTRPATGAELDFAVRRIGTLTGR